jgi:O-methyltransferase
MLGNTIRRMLRPLQLAARRFVMLPAEGSYTGTHGCLYTAASFVTWNQVEGDYLEFGVYRGDSFAVAYHALQRQRRSHASRGDNSPEYQRWKQTRPRFFAFDSFEGLPEGSATRHVDYAPVDLKDVVVVPGFYDRTLNAQMKEQHGLRRAAMVMIDCDLYESTVPVLEFLTDLVGQGTILIFHDWFRFRGSPKHGEQRACREWLDRNPHLELIEYWREGPQAVSFLVNLR